MAHTPYPNPPPWPHDLLAFEPMLKSKVGLLRYEAWTELSLGFLANGGRRFVVRVGQFEAVFDMDRAQARHLAERLTTTDFEIDREQEGLP